MHDFCWGLKLKPIIDLHELQRNYLWHLLFFNLILHIKVLLIDRHQQTLIFKYNDFIKKYVYKSLNVIKTSSFNNLKLS